MKKYLALTAVAVLVALAAPAFAATNPFMDVPLNHWAYDAIGQLAAEGILSGYPDGTYKGKQPTTRYEMASAVARALAVVDLTKASKADVEMLKRLVIEFKDELDALGVKVDELDKRVAVIESRLGGWKIGGQMRLDIDDYDTPEGNLVYDAEDPDGTVNLSRARVYFDRVFGEDESLHFYGRLDWTAGSLRWDQFYADMPAFVDSRLFVGRFLWDKESAYYYQSVVDGMTGDAVLTDRRFDGLGWQKSFGMGNVTAYAARQGVDTFAKALNAWEFFLMGEFQFNEQFGFDLGLQYFKGDSASPVLSDAEAGYFKDGVWVPAVSATYKVEFDNLWTAFGGLRFNFTPDITFKGIFYQQHLSVTDTISGLDATGPSVWNISDKSKAFKVILDVKQEALNFTSLWLAYERYDGGFIVPTGLASLFLGGNGDDFQDSGYYTANPADQVIYRIGANQKWNDQWSTSVYYARHKFDFNSSWEPTITQWAVGVNYQYRPEVRFGLFYTRTTFDADEWNTPTLDENFIRFRTTVTF